MKIRLKKSTSSLSTAIIWADFIIKTIVCLIIRQTKDYQWNLDGISFIIIVSSSLLVLISIIKKGKNNYERIVLLLSYLLCLFLLFCDRYIRPLEIGDAERFHLTAIQKAVGDYSNRYGGLYTDIVGIIYRAYGPSRVIGQYFNVLLFISALYEMIDTFYIHKLDRKAQFIGLCLIAFNPHLLTMIVILRRESVIVLLLAVSFKQFILWWEEQSAHNFIVSVLISLVASLFHSGVISLALGYIMIYILYNKDKKVLEFTKKSSLRIIVCCVCFVVFYLKFSNVFLGKFMHYSGFDELNDTMNRAAGGSGYTVGFRISNSFLDFIINTPLRVLYFLLSPMPWDWRGLGDIIAFALSSVYYTFGFGFAYKAIKKHNSLEEKTIIQSCIIILLVFCTFFAWGTRNAGTAMRHRDKMVIPYVFMIALTIPQRIFSNKNEMIER